MNSYSDTTLDIDLFEYSMSLNTLTGVIGKTLASQPNALTDVTSQDELNMNATRRLVMC